MEIGLVIPQGWYADATNNIREIAKNAEDLGFDGLYAYDHLIPYNNYASIHEPIYECMTLLSLLAGVTEKIKLGSVVLCNSYRNPTLLAKMASTLDNLSNGRLVFGIGAGWYREEYERFGYRFERASVRLEQLDESLRIIKGLWSNDEFRFDGKYYKVNAMCNPKPYQKPYPKFMIGGSGDNLLKIVARYADIYNNPFGSIDKVKDRITKLREYCKIIGRDHKEIELSLLIRAVIGKESEIKSIINRLKKDESIEQYMRREAIIINDTSILKEYAKIGITNFIIHLFDTNYSNMARLKDMIRLIGLK